MKNILITFIVLIYSFSGGYCQPPSLLDSLSKELIRDDISVEVRINLYLKLAFYNSKDPIQKLDYAEHALKLSQQHNIIRYQARSYLYIGNAHLSLGNRLKSIDALIQSAQLFRKINQLNDEASALTTIGTLFIKEADIQNAIAYQKQGLHIFTQVHDTALIAATLLNIGETYRIFDETDSAEYYYKQALLTISTLNSLSQKSAIDEYTIKGNLGMIHLEQGKIAQAKEELNLALNFFLAQNDPYYASIYQSELAKIYILEGNQQKGEQLITESLKMTEKAQLKEQIRDFNQQLAEFYEEQKQYDKAYKHFKQYKLYDDTLKNVENVRKLEQQQSQFQLSRKDEEIASLNKINKLQRVLALGLFFGVVTVIVFIFIVSSSNKRIKLINQEILVQKQLVEQREQEKALLLRELNHRVKNNLQMVASLLNLHARQLKDHPAAEALLAGKYRVEALTLIHQKLYRDDIDTKIDIKDYIEELSQNLVMNFSKDFNLELNLESFVMKIDKAIPLGLVLNELLTNSLKYGKSEDKQPFLKISNQKINDTIKLQIEDNGDGLPSDFDFKQTDSFGLKLVHSLIQQLGGKIEWSSNKGTRWVITLLESKIN